jgi:hypothetical protein
MLNSKDVFDFEGVPNDSPVCHKNSSIVSPVGSRGSLPCCCKRGSSKNIPSTGGLAVNSVLVHRQLSRNHGLMEFDGLCLFYD